MYARVKSKAPYKTTVACGGLIFSQDSWRHVPAHEETAAKADPLLETADKIPEADAEAKLVQPAPKRTVANDSKTVKLVNRKPVEESSE